MNISRLREMLKVLPETFDPVEITDALAEELIEECEELVTIVKEVRRVAAIAELQEALARVAVLQARAGVQPTQVPPPVRPPTREPSPLDETDAGMGVREPREDNVSAQSFNDELEELRERTRQKRRRLG